VKQILLRVSGLIVGAVSAYISLNALYVPMITFMAESEWQKTHPPNYFYVVLYFGVLGIVAFLFGWLSYASFRYAIRPYPQTDAK
jgi:H+/Cl- antiporter ClcA